MQTLRVAAVTLGLGIMAAGAFVEESTIPGKAAGVTSANVQARDEGTRGEAEGLRRDVSWGSVEGSGAQVCLDDHNSKEIQAGFSSLHAR